MAKIDPITVEKATPEIKKVLAELHEYYGNIPMIYRVIVRKPDITKALFQLKKSIMESGRIDKITKEKMAVIVSIVNKCQPSAEAHINNLKKLNVGQTEIESLKKLDFSKYEEEESVLFEFTAKASSNPPEITSELFETLKNIYNPTEIVEIVNVIALYKYLNTINIIFELPPY